jgi:apolipoprotein N-acyltransferase
LAEKLRRLLRSLPRSRFLRDWGIACISSLLLYLAFYPANLSFLAWFALVPWLVVASRREPVQAGLISLAAGFVHFTLAIWWIGVVTYSGLVLSALILAAFT